ncbi:conjugal transfer protein TraF [Simkania negevensis]|uniref:Conjugal transfer disulfide-bond formation protein TraF n=1 Tax=Simkania negevensis (strain ATCC VR-1471 / DSM 27360 / Z) TaxID=331113 RepID=F8L2X9_SIMNZ|nr:conjugal transfer protein TraF [Simkania negevensis]CCB87825.1 conjugal transfer disulfide-bond formation protein TraF [Simkania negevensis Z]
MKAKLLLLLLFPCFCFSDFYQEGHFVGFYFFEDPEPKKEEEEISRDYSKVNDPNEAQRITKENNERFQKAIDLATLNPTPDHILRALQIQSDIVDRSLKFSEEVRRFIIENPEIGAVFDTPISQRGMNVKKVVEKAEKEAIISQIKEKYFLLLFAEGGCPYSEIAADVALMMEEEYGLKVRIVVVNDKPFKHTSNELKSKSLPALFSVNRFPVFFLVNPSSLQRKSNQLIDFERYAVGAGMVSLTEIVNNIYRQALHYHLVDQPLDFHANN